MQKFKILFFKVKKLKKNRPNNSSNGLITTLKIIDDIIWNGCHSFQCCTFHHETWFGALWLSLCANDLTFCLCLSLQLIILQLPLTEFLGAP